MIAMSFFRVAPAIVALAALASIGVTNAHAETLDELYQKAKAEKDRSCSTPAGRRRRTRTASSSSCSSFPGIAVSVTGGFSNVLNEKIEQQMAANKLEVDMAFFQTVQDFVAWKKEGKLLAFKPDGFDQIYRELQRPRRRLHGARRQRTSTYAYNTKLVKPQDAPKSALDFLKPMFPGKLITCYPADDDATLYLFHVIVQKYGWGWMDKYMANKPNFVQGHLPVARSVADGKNIVDARRHVTRPPARSSAPARRSSWCSRAEDETPVFTLDRRHLQGRAASRTPPSSI